MDELKIREKLENGELMNWKGISKESKLSESFIREFQDYVDWSIISQYQSLSEEFIFEFEDKVDSEGNCLLDWDLISQCQTLSEKFIIKFQNRVNWNEISANQILSENFIKEFQNKVNWDEISWNQTLSEDFIREFQDKVSWDEISWNQTLSEDFIREFQDKVSWDYILECQTLSTEFKNEFKNISSSDIEKSIPLEDNNEKNITLADFVKLKNSLGKVVVSEWTTSDTDNRFKTNLVECSSLKDIKNKFTNLQDYTIFEINIVSDTLCILVTNPKNIKRVCISIKTLFEKFGDILTFNRIYSDEGYYDLKNEYEETVCMDGESCIVLDKNEDSVILLNEDGKETVIFKLSLEEFKIATFS